MVEWFSSLRRVIPPSPASQERDRARVFLLISPVEQGSRFVHSGAFSERE